MKKVIVMGGVGSGFIASCIIDTMPDTELIGFLNDGYPVGTMLGGFRKVRVIGSSKDVHRLIEDDDTYVLLAYKTMKHEREMWGKFLSLDIPREKLINLIHPTAIIPKGHCSVGRGVLMAANSQLSADTVISDNCILFGNAFVGHNSILDRYVTVANNASIGAEVHVGKAAHIGSNCTIRHDVKIGDYSLVGMGSLVLHDVPDNTIAMGVPAKIVEKKE